jgi:hypothetical protein
MKPPLTAETYEPSELLSWYLDIAEALLGNGRLAPKEQQVLAALWAELQPRVNPYRKRF